MSTLLRVGAAQYPIEEPKTLEDFLQKLTRWVEAGVSSSDLLVFPEYGGAEAMAILGREINRDLLQATFALQPFIPVINDHIQQLAQSHGVYILAPSLPVVTSSGALQNHARLHAPNGQSGVQGKRILTPFDQDIWHITPAPQQTLFQTPFGLIGVAICYDVEFPVQIRNMVEAGAEVILCPSCTDTLAGYWRVRVGAMARALENQCAVVQSPTIGHSTWTSALDINRGAAGVFAPPDMAISDNGVLAVGEMDQPQWLHSVIDLDKLKDIRAHGEVRTYRDWPKQTATQIQCLDLC